MQKMTKRVLKSFSGNYSSVFEVNFSSSKGEGNARIRINFAFLPFHLTQTISKHEVKVHYKLFDEENRNIILSFKMVNFFLRVSKGKKF